MNGKSINLTQFEQLRLDGQLLNGKKAEKDWNLSIEIGHWHFA